jgi:LPS-assembly protein
VQKNTLIIIIINLLLGTSSITAIAADPSWLLCGPPVGWPKPRSLPLTSDVPMAMTADVAQFNEDKGKGLLFGNVEIQRENQYLRAEQVQYSEQDARITAEEGVIFNEEGLTVTGPHAEMHLDTNTAEFSEAAYWFTPRHARGKAARVYRASPTVLELYGASYTTCNPGDTDWLIKSDHVTLDRGPGDGTARNVLLKFKRIPLLYLPWYRFPIDDRRKSGFLAPSIGSTSTSGLAIVVPFYWNMAPNRDLVFSPRYLSERGVQLNGVFRYLYPWGGGDSHLEYINDSKNSDDRYFISLNDASKLSPRLMTSILFNKVSDDDYFADFGHSLTQTSITHLQQRADARYYGTFWNVLTRLQKYQTIDSSIAPSNRPYERLPQLLFNARLPEQNFGLGYKLRSELVRFDRDTGVTGDRFGLALGIDRPLVTAGFYFKPKLGMHFTGYNLRNTVFGADSTPSRSLPIASVDSGLIFERRWGDGYTLQTLEPRLFYLYAPFRDQEDIPVFDTTRLDFNFSELFVENRFAGGDRIGDANQLTVALTSRLIDTRNGHETLDLSFGQIYYFRDREVTLPGGPPEITNSSDMIGELSMRISDRWTARGTTIVDPHENNIERASMRLQYKGENNRILNLSYGFRRDELEQTDLAFAWPVSPNWEILGRWNYDVDEQRTLELLGGLEYDTCCWAARVVTRRFINSANGDFNNTFEAQLVLKGLGKLGSSLERTLERGILGYEAD